MVIGEDYKRCGSSLEMRNSLLKDKILYLLKGNKSCADKNLSEFVFEKIEHVV